MLVSTDYTTITAKRAFTITDGPDYDGFRVSYGAITYTLTDEGWDVRSWSDITLHGNGLKKNGQPGASRRNGRILPLELRTKTPELGWLWEILSELRPGADHAFTALHDFEVNA